MININGIQVDITTNANDLSTKWAIFTIEFEFDNKLIVCHTFNQPIYKKINNLINQALSPNTKNIELQQALLNSKYITINIEERELQSKYKILARKYELIEKNMAYLPYGHNALIKVGNTLEQSHADILLQKLIDGNIIQTRSANKKGKISKIVYSYDKQTKLLISRYTSIKDAAKNTGICASNISMCCNGHIKTAGGRIWSYINKPMINVN